MELITVIGLYINILLKKLLPIHGHLSLYDMLNCEECLTIFASKVKFLLRDFEVSILFIELQFETILLVVHWSQ